MADIERIGRRGIIKDTQQGNDHIWVGRRGLQQEQAAAAGGATPSQLRRTHRVYELHNLTR